MAAQILLGLSRALRGASTSCPPARQISHAASSAFNHGAPKQDYNQGDGQSQREGAQGDEHIVLPVVERWDVEQNNTFTLTGNVTAQPSMRVDRNGRSILNLSVCRNRRRKNATGGFTDETPEFYNFLVMGPLAVAVMAQVRRGQKVIVRSVVSSKPGPGQDETNRDSPHRLPMHIYSFLARGVTLVATPRYAQRGQQGQGETTQE